MTHFCYPPYNGIRAPAFTRPTTPEQCLKFYLRHARNVMLLERIKGLHKGDFRRCQSIETEIATGVRKCEYWYKRGDFTGADIAREIPKIKSAINALDLTPFKE